MAGKGEQPEDFPYFIKDAEVYLWFIVSMNPEDRADQFWKGIQRLARSDVTGD